MSQYNIPGYGLVIEAAARQWAIAGYGLFADSTADGGSTDVTPEAALIAGTGDQPAPAVMGDANLAPNSIDQETELVDPDIDTTQNLGVGNYRSTKVTMNW